MQLLPSELVHIIVELSSDSPSSLAALALTHSSCQGKAEMALYDTLWIRASSENSLKCVEVLASNPEKAALVRFLTIEYTDNMDENREGRLTTYLSKSLINMHSLSDFRLRSRRRNLGKAWMKDLSKILCHDFEFLDISQIIKSQTELKILGINSRSIIIIKTLKELHNAQSFLPIIVLTRNLVRVSGPDIFPDHICIFPAFCSVNRHAAIPPLLAQSFCKDQGIFLVVKAEDIRGLSIYMTDSSDIPSIRALAKDMAASFPKIRFLGLWFERRCEIPPQEIMEEFSFFSNLHNVCTGFYPSYPIIPEGGQDGPL